MRLHERSSHVLQEITREVLVQYELELMEGYEEIDCPACGGDGHVYGWSYETDEEHRITCPACNGEGTIEAGYYIEETTAEEYVTVSDTITPYQDDELAYSYSGCADYMTQAQELQLNSMMEDRFESLRLEKEKEKEKEKNKILEKIKSLDFSKFEELGLKELEQIAQLVER